MPIKFSLWFTNFIIPNFIFLCKLSMDKTAELERRKMACPFTYSSLRFMSYISLLLTMRKLPENDFKSNRRSPFTVYNNNRNKVAPWFSLLDMDVYFLFRVIPCHKYFPIKVQWIHTHADRPTILRFNAHLSHGFLNECEISQVSCHLDIEWVL